jgi:Fic family protein
MEALGFDLRAEANLLVLTSEVVNSSAIEGESLKPEEVRSSIARRLGLDVGGLPEPGREVEGVVEMTLDATQNFDAPLTNDRLFGWHASLFPTGRSGMSRITVGTWRPKEAGPMQVVSGPMGTEKVHFEAPEAERLESEMARFLEWLNSPLAIDPVLKAGIAHFWFVTIHPFEDGNGRIARAIGDMALSQADGTSEYHAMADVVSWLPRSGDRERRKDASCRAAQGEALAANQPPPGQQSTARGDQSDVGGIRGIPDYLQVRQARQVLTGHGAA